MLEEKTPRFRRNDLPRSHPFFVVFYSCFPFFFLDRDPCSNQVFVVGSVGVAQKGPRPNRPAVK